MSDYSTKRTSFIKYNGQKWSFREKVIINKQQKNFRQKWINSDLLMMFLCLWYFFFLLINGNKTKIMFWVIISTISFLIYIFSRDYLEGANLIKTQRIVTLNNFEKKVEAFVRFLSKILESFFAMIWAIIGFIIVISIPIGILALFILFVRWVWYL